MIRELFFSVLNMSITASFAIIAVIFVRYFIRKQPKLISYVLWSVVLFRLLCPWSFTSEFSAFNALSAAETTTDGQIEYIFAPETEKSVSTDAVIEDYAVTAPKYIANHNVLIHYDMGPDYSEIIAVIWISGITVLLINSILQAQEIKKLLINSTKLQKNVYINDNIDTAFVWGIISPVIYLPADLSNEQQIYIILHENVHIRRKDYIFKLLGFAALCIHWFNPFVWIAFRMAEKDMEMACDEAVIKEMTPDETIGYSQTLLMLSSGITFSPSAAIAFNENNIKERIKNILNFKPVSKKYIVVLTVLLMITVGIFAVNPVTEQISVNENDINNSSDNVYHIVQAGETVWEIAEKYNISMDSLKYFNPDIEEGIVPGETIQVKPAAEVSGYGKPESIYTFFVKPDEPLDVMAETAAQVYFNALGDAEEYSLIDYKITRPMDSDNEYANTPYKLANDFMYAVLIEFTHTSLPAGTPGMKMVLYIQPLSNSNYVIVGALSPVSKDTAIQYSENRGKNIWPLLFGNISRGYTGQYPRHNGIDIAADIGSHIFAVADGTVTKVVSANMGYGVHCIIDHGDYFTLYAHCDSLEVVTGQKVQQGQLIGYVGNTGNSTGPHLHLEVYTNIHGDKVTMNPYEYF